MITIYDWPCLLNLINCYMSQTEILNDCVWNSKTLDISKIPTYKIYNSHTVSF